MKKLLRIGLRLLGVLVLLLLIVVFVSVEKIETDPYFESQYYENTQARLADIKTNLNLETAPLEVGFAAIDITPKLTEGPENPLSGSFKQVRLAGYGDGQMATGTHDSLMAKATALKVGAEVTILVSGDLLLIPENVVDNIMERLRETSGIKREQLFFGATHTHASIGNIVPGYIGKQFGGDYQEGMVDWLGQQFSKVILAALDDLKPSKMGYGHTKIPQLIRNRIIGETGRLHDQLDVVRLEQIGGKKGIIGIFGAHATSISTWNSEFSGDYPGAYQRALLQKGWDHSQFFAGTVGSHSNKGEGKRFEKIERMAQILADSTQRIALRTPLDSLVTSARISLPLEIPKIQAIKIADSYRLAPWLANKIMPERKAHYLQALRLNGLIWHTSPVELSGEFGIDMNNALENAGYSSVITSFNGQYLGYSVPGKYYYYDTYETALMGWFGPSMGEYIMELNYSLANLLTESRH
ncbi:neutral/alkaline non-lysosomal ceramidase N-terminal domain-containing protein [Sediminicola luteus]|uniref:Neutral/alkaline non-lysosomal ceramidase N-terminal domain-containing protein n=1 Tax=Sediminicola luteus TaxID=319238 RepID=A0A2A4G7Y9_9FLAO|nr:neutral/alkaline non-lysosomal ceramidase N-terminal domain-containing protein [Sediminicola luteus]PCE64737.1 hypothetical protein B7P33_06085 [Sediminicola luteus]